MSTLVRDPLLAVSRAITTFIIVVLAVAAIGCLVGIPLALFYHGQISIEVANEGLHNPDDRVRLAIAAILVLVVAAMAMSIRFLLYLRSIIDSVGAGDPFVAENADRLRAMGWLSLAVQAVTIPTTLLGFYIEETLAQTGDHDLYITFSGLFLTLILFILARVFRKGAEMRADLEGTV